MQEHGPWKIKQTHQIYKDPYIDVTKDDVVRPDGNDGTHVKVYMKAGVSVLPLDEDDNVYLTREFHYAVGRETLEVVSGGIEPGDDPQTTARKELREELGIVAEEFAELGTVDPFTTIIESPTKLFLATRLSFVESELEGTEVIECVKLPFEAVVQMVMQGEITHAPSCVAILKTAMNRALPQDI